MFQGPSGTFSDLERENWRYSLQVMSNLSFFDVFRRKIAKTQDISYLRKGIVRHNVLNTMQPKGAKSVEKFGDIIEKRRKSRKKSSYCVKFDLVRGGARLHFNAKRLGRPSFLIQKKSFKQHTSEIKGVVCNCSVSWRGMTLLLLLHRKIKIFEHKGSIRDAVAATTLEILSTPFSTLLYDLNYL